MWCLSSNCCLMLVFCFVCCGCCGYVVGLWLGFGWKSCWVWVWIWCILLVWLGSFWVCRCGCGWRCVRWWDFCFGCCGFVVCIWVGCFCWYVGWGSCLRCIFCFYGMVLFRCVWWWSCRGVGWLSFCVWVLVGWGWWLVCSLWDCLLSFWCWDWWFFSSVWFCCLFCGRCWVCGLGCG